MQSEYVDANGIKIHYHRTGGDKPSIVLAHGFSDNGLCWMGIVPALQDDYDVIMYDSRGHGLSDAPETGYSIDDRVEDLAGLIRVLKLEKPILMGHSMGAGTVGWTIAKYPDIARAAILEDPGFHRRTQQPLSEEELKVQMEKRRAEILKRKNMTRQQLIELVSKAVHSGWRQEEYGPWADSKLQLSPNVVQAFSGSRRSWIGDAFVKTRIPVLILKQDTDEEGKKRDQEVASLLPDGKLAHVEGAGHSIRRDRYEATVEILKSFLQSVG
ncbi:alpha/beta fold hydrolase [Candidatus Poribacteria bacterium]